MIPVYSAGQRIIVTADPTGELVGFIGVVMKSNSREQNRPAIVLVYNREGVKIPAIALNLWERRDVEIKEAKLGEIKAEEPNESFD
jgi:hypothetical protein